MFVYAVVRVPLTSPDVVFDDASTVTSMISMISMMSTTVMSMISMISTTVMSMMSMIST